jgi:predicted aspartyl protease
MVGCSWFLSEYKGKMLNAWLIPDRHTALSRDLAALLGIESDPSRTVAIAPAHGAIIRVPLITIAELSIGGFRLTDVGAVVLELPHQLRFDGLLGMNVLRQFRMTIEIETQTLVLRPIRSPSS